MAVRRLEGSWIAELMIFFRVQLQVIARNIAFPRTLWLRHLVALG